MKVKYFRWHCPQCGVFGGMQLDAQTPDEVGLEKCRQHHLERQEDSSYGAIRCEAQGFELEAPPAT